MGVDLRKIDVVNFGVDVAIVFIGMLFQVEEQEYPKLRKQFRIFMVAVQRNQRVFSGANEFAQDLLVRLQRVGKGALTEELETSFQPAFEGAFRLSAR